MTGVITIDCAGATTADEVWRRYHVAVDPDFEMPFGRNLDAFWDAVEGGGPGCPGEDVELHFTNTAGLAGFRDGQFLAALNEIADRASFVRIVVS